MPRSRRRRANSASISSPTAATNPTESSCARQDSRICRQWISSAESTCSPTSARFWARWILCLARWTGEGEAPMSVRRLAEIQPDSFEFTSNNEAWARQEIAKYPPGRQASAVLALLWRAQQQNGYWLPRPAIEKVAEMLAMPFMRVLEVATFYTMFNLSPVGRHYVQLCGTTPCMLRGAEAIKTVCRSRIGEERRVSADGKFSWVEVECLGACCNAPMVQINEDYYEDLTPENFAALLDDLAAGRPVRVGSQTGRVGSEPEGRLTTLTTLYGGDGHGGAALAPAANDGLAGI